MAMTIAQLVAVISADTASFSSRLSKVEAEMKATQAVSEKSASAISNHFNNASTGIKNTTQAFSLAQKGAANLAKFEYETGQKTAADYKQFLAQRMSSYEAYTAEWKAAATQMVSVEKALETERASNYNQISKQIEERKKQEVSQRLQAEREAIEQEEALLNQLTAAIEAAAKKQDTAFKEAQLQLERNQQAVANLAKFEYEQGTLSAEAYKVFLQRRMAAYEEYTSEWKSASVQLVSLERDMLAEREAANSEYEQRLNAQVREALSERAAIEKEMTAILAEEDEKRFAANTEAVRKYVAEQKTAAAETAAAWKSAASGAGTISAGIAGAELATGIMYSGFEAKTAAVANNTLMTNQQLAEMRKAVLTTSAATGSEFDDTSDGYMRIANHAYKGKEAIDILNISAKEAISTQSKVDSTANALAGTMHVFHLKGGEAANTMNLISIAAARGNSTIQEWTDNTGTATGMAANYHVQLAQVEAALSALTQQKFSTSASNTQIVNLLNHITNPTAEARKNIELLEARANSMGISLVKDFSSAGLASRQLYGVLYDIKTVTGGNAEAVNSMIGAMRGGIGAMALMNSGAKDYHDALVLTTKAQKGLADTTVDQRFNRAMSANTNEWKKFIRTVQVEFMPVGQKAMQVFITWMPSIKKLADVVLDCMTAFQKLPQQVQSVITLFGALTIVAKLGVDFLRLFGASVKLVDGLRLVIKALGDNEGLIWAFRGAAGAGTGFGASLSELALAGTGPLALVALAVAGLVFEIYKLKQAYDDMVSAQDDATRSAQGFANMQKSVAAQGEKGALIVNQQQIAITRSALQSKLDAGVAPATGFVPKGTIQGFQTDTGGWMSQSQSKAYAKTLQSQIDKLSTDFDTEGQRLHTIDTTSHDSAGPLGAKIAKSAEAIDLSANQFSGHCERLANTIREGNTHLFDAYHKASAAQTAMALYNAGLMQPYTPGMSLNPGSQLYSTTLGMHSFKSEKNNGPDGHVETVISGGRFADQHGISNSPHFGAKNYQYVFDPDYAASKLGASGVPEMPPTSTGVSHADMSSLAAKAKALKDAQKAAEAEAKAAQRHYKDEMQSLEMIIALKKKKEDLDTNQEVAKTTQDLSSGGSLSLIKDKAQREKLLQAAAKADVAEHAAYISALIDKMHEAVAIASKPYLEQQAISKVGSLDKWSALGGIGTKNPKTGYSSSQQSYLSAIQTTEDTDARFKAIKSLKDLAFAQKIVGDEVKNAAVEAEGGAEKWQLLDGATQKVVLDTQRQIKSTEALNSLLLDFQKKSEDAGNIKSNTQAAQSEIDALVRKGVIDDPKRLRSMYGPLSQKQSSDLSNVDKTLGAAGKADQGDAGKFLEEQQRSLASKLEDKQKLAEKFSPDNADAGQSALDKWKKDNFDAIDNVLKHGTDAEKQKLNAFEARLRKEAQDEENSDAASFLIEQQKSLTAKNKELSNSMADMYNPSKKAVDDWEAANEIALQRIRTDWGDVGDAAIKAYEKELVAQTAAQTAAAANSKVVEGTISAYQQFYDLSAKTPFDKYLDTFKQFQKIGEDSSGKSLYDFVLPPGFDVNLAKANFQLQNQLNLRIKIASMMSEGAQGLTQGVMNGLQNAFSPDPQKTGTLQSQLYNQQTEQMQYQVAEQQFNNQYPGDPNDPYIARLKLIQQQIDTTNSQLKAMGNNLTSVFTRFFQSIYDTFKQTLVKMAQEYLQSQLLSYITKQVGTGSGFTGGSSWAGGVVGGINTLLSFLPTGGGGSGGGSAPISSTTSNGWPSISAATGSDGTLTLATGAWKVPGPSGAGDVMPAMLSPNEMVLPVSVANRVRAGISGEPLHQTTINNNTWHITTPDVQGVRASRATIAQQFRSAVRTMR